MWTGGWRGMKCCGICSLILIASHKVQCRRAFRTNLKKIKKMNFRSLHYSFKLIRINNDMLPGLCETWINLSLKGFTSYHCSCFQLEQSRVKPGRNLVS